MGIHLEPPPPTPKKRNNRDSGEYLRFFDMQTLAVDQAEQATIKLKQNTLEMMFPLKETRTPIFNCFSDSNTAKNS